MTAAGKTAHKTPRKPRTDAVRNRERVLEAANMVFGAGGPDASLEAVARTAGVGIGTLYRHFPTREALFEAVYRREVQQLAALPGARVPPCLTRLRIAHEPHHLRIDILQLELARVKFRCAKQVLLATIL